MSHVKESGGRCLVSVRGPRHRIGETAEWRREEVRRGWEGAVTVVGRRVERRRKMTGRIQGVGNEADAGKVDSEQREIRRSGAGGERQKPRTRWSSSGAPRILGELKSSLRKLIRLRRRQRPRFADKDLRRSTRTWSKEMLDVDRVVGEKFEIVDGAAKMVIEAAKEAAMKLKSARERHRSVAKV